MAVINHMGMDMCNNTLMVSGPPKLHVYVAASQAAQADLASHCPLCEFGAVGPGIQLELELCVQVADQCFKENDDIVCSAEPRIGVEVTEVTYVEYSYATADSAWRGYHRAEIGTPRYWSPTARQECR